MQNVVWLMAIEAMMAIRGIDGEFNRGAHQQAINAVRLLHEMMRTGRQEKREDDYERLEELIKALNTEEPVEIPTESKNTRDGRATRKTDKGKKKR
jgi:hypothetical protein